MLLAQHVAERLSVASESEVGRYLLIDTAATFGERVPEALRWSDHALDLLSGTPPDWRTGASPVLLRAPTSAIGVGVQGAWLRFAERWRYANSLTYLESSLKFDELAAALRPRMSVMLGENMQVLLRLQDNRTLWSLLSVLDAAQCGRLLCVARHWAYADRRGEALLADAPRPDRRPQGDAWVEATAYEPLCLSMQQETAMLEMSDADNTIGVLLEQANSVLLTLLPPEQHSRVSALLLAANELHIQQTPDRVAFCATGLELGEGFQNQQPWVDLLVDVRNERRRFTDLLSDLERDAA